MAGFKPFEKDTKSKDPKAAKKGKAPPFAKKSPGKKPAGRKC